MMKRIRNYLISPDDQTPLIEKDGCWFDKSGNKYFTRNGKPDFHPRNPIEGHLKYRLVNHAKFRSFQYARFLRPLFPIKEMRTKGIKKNNLNGFIPPAGKDSICLDHGCGGGEMRSYIESFDYEYVGVDDESGVTTKQGGGNKFSGGADYLCDLHRLPFAENTFKFGVSYSVFEHLQNPFVAAEELYRVMQPGGVCFVAVGSILPFHMDSFYHHTHFGVLNTFQHAGFTVDQIAPADWNSYLALSDMDGLPGPKWVRHLFSYFIYNIHRLLWLIRTKIKKRSPADEELRRLLLMPGIVKAILIKPE